jgi:hypothetical protein
MIPFDAEELAEVADALPLYFKEDLSPETEEGVNFLADSLMDMLRTTRSLKEKRGMIAQFISMAVMSGMLIQSRRINLEAMMYRNNTGGYDC